jgi:hypothetical protein
MPLSYHILLVLTPRYLTLLEGYNQISILYPTTVIYDDRHSEGNRMPRLGPKEAVWTKVQRKIFMSA